jgi:hypothetical protein
MQCVPCVCTVSRWQFCQNCVKECRTIETGRCGYSAPKALIFIGHSVMQSDRSPSAQTARMVTFRGWLRQDAGYILTEECKPLMDVRRAHTAC